MSRGKSQQDNRNKRKSSHNHDYLVKLRGIPNSCSKDDVKEFLHPCRVDTIHSFNSRGTFSDECLVDLESEVDVDKALKKTNQLMKNKYIEVIRSSIHEYHFFGKHNGKTSWRDPVIRMSGLPYSCTMIDIQNFFKDIAIARNGIYITRDMTDNALGDGYVAFVNMESAFKAIDLCNRKHIQHRYIDLSPSTYEEAKEAIIKDADLNGKQFAGEDKDGDYHVDQQPNDRQIRRSRSSSRKRDRRFQIEKHQGSLPPSSPRPSRRRSREKDRRPSHSQSSARQSSRTSTQNREYRLKMRGMPYTVAERDIREFFPSTCQPVRIEILCDRRTNRSNGDAHVYFENMDKVNEAKKCDRKYMSNRYVEVYFDSNRRSPSEYRPNPSNDSSHRSSNSSLKRKRGDRSRSQSE